MHYAIIITYDKYDKRYCIHNRHVIILFMFGCSNYLAFKALSSNNSDEIEDDP